MTTKVGERRGEEEEGEGGGKVGGDVEPLQEPSAAGLAVHAA